MLSSQMMFDKSPSYLVEGGERREEKGGGGSRRTRTSSSRNRSDSIPRHGATDPSEKYYGSQASYYGKEAVEGYGHVASRAPAPAVTASMDAGGQGGALWEIYEDEPRIHTTSVSGNMSVNSGGAGGQGGAYWDIYSDAPSYKGPSYRDLRYGKTSHDSSTKEKGKGYEMRRSAPIDSPYDMVADHDAAMHGSGAGSVGHSKAQVGTSSSNYGDLQSAGVQKTVRPEGGLGFSRWGERQESAHKPSFLGVDAEWYK
eukprot:CAMPEP_0184483254 /NCGR_PEP_ID=MMETSP0113_2-20130426/4901_1 /TAXON_ID=91329 /ORGANISM="Norrisiella sphaerica, Strain BC52" /LENGTH=255 /DNA_ID=CAMNT_0026863537 /DNA_START=54 /DNA_END=821 /DNA_ORIENTATION=-